MADKPDKSLKGKAINIKGKEYVLVSDRIVYFNEQYTNGSIETLELPDEQRVKFKAIVTPDVDKPSRIFTGHSQAVWGDGMVNKTAATENAETSAVGRALAMMGIGVIDSIASVDEINKAKTQPVATKFATGKQIDWMRDIARKASGLEHNDDVDAWMAESDVLSIPPQQVPIYKVKDAITKMELIIANDKAAMAASDGVDDIVEVTDEDMAALDRGELPY